MPAYKFGVGEIVAVKPDIMRNLPGGRYQVTRQLPESAGEIEYRVKSANEPHERVVRQRDLTKVPAVENTTANEPSMIQGRHIAVPSRD